MHDEGHDAGGQNIVLHVGVPRSPGLLEDIEVDVILCDVVVVVVVGDRLSGEGGIPKVAVNPEVHLFSGSARTHTF